MRKSWTEKKSNEEVMEIQKIPAENHQKKTTTIIGHINRANRLGKKIMSGKMCGTVPKAEEANVKNTQTV